MEDEKQELTAEEILRAMDLAEGAIIYNRDLWARWMVPAREIIRRKSDEDKWNALIEKYKDRHGK